MLGEFNRDCPHRCKIEPGSLGDIEQRVLAVGKIEHPEARHVVVGDVSTGGSIQPSFAKGRLAERIRAFVRQVVLEHLEDVRARPKRLGQR